MSLKPFNSVAGYSVGETPSNIILANGDITGTIANFSGNVTAPYFIGNVIGNISGNLAVNGPNTGILFNDSGSANSVGAFTFDKTSNLVTIKGNVYLGGASNNQLMNLSNSILEIRGGWNDSVNQTGVTLIAGDYANNTKWGKLAVSGNSSGNAAIQAEANFFYWTQPGGGPTYVTINTLNANATSTSTGALTVNGGVGVSGNIYSGGQVTVTGNVSASYYIGNGSLLTGLTTDSISNGTSNVSIPAVNGNVNISSAGNANILVVTGTGVNVAGTLNTGTGNANVGNLGTSGTVIASTLQSNVSTGTAPLVVASTTLVTNLNADLLDGYNTAIANTASTVAVRDTSGNLSANYFIGNGSQLTGLVTDSISNGTSNVSIPTSSGNVNTSVGGVSNVLVVTSTGVNVAGTFNATGNVTGGNLITSGILSVTGNANVGNLGTTGLITATSNVTGGNLITSGILSVTGNANIGNLGTTGSITATSNVTGGNLVTSGVLSVTGNADVGNLNTTGNVTAGYLFGNGSQLTGVAAATANALANGTSNVSIPTASGNVITSVGGVSNVFIVTTTGVNVAGTLNATGNTTSGNLLTAGTVIASTLQSNVSTGTAPLVVASTTLVSNLNADLLDGYNTAIANTASTVAVRDTSGNLSANYFIGNGSQLTGLNTSIISNGTSNVSIPAVNGNVNISSAGNANILVVTGTGANITGTLNATGNANTGNIGAVNGVFTNITGTLTTAAQPNITSVGTLTSLTISGNLTSGNANLGNVASANYINVASTITMGGGSGGNLTGANVITANTFTGAFANGNSNVNIPAANGNVNISAVGNANILVVTGTGVNVFGTLNSTGNANVGNIGAAAGVFTGAITGSTTLNITGNANVGNIGAAAGVFTGAITGSTTLNITGNANVGNLGTSGNITAGYYFGNGSQLTGISAVTSNALANGTSNVTIPTASGNVNTSVGGTANVLVVTTTGANITGTLNASGNANTGNIGATNGVFTNIFGTIQTASQTNITAVGTLGTLNVSGNANVGNLGTTGLITATGNVSGGNITTVGQVVATGNVSGNYFIGNGSQLTGLITDSISNGTSNVSIPAVNGNINISSAGNANILVVTGTGVNVAGTLNATGNANVGNLGTAGRIISTLATGTAPFTVSSSTRVANLNVDYANVSDYSVVTTQTTGVYYPTLASGNTTANYALASNSALSFNIATGNFSAPALYSNTTITANTGLTVTSGGMTITGNLNITGNINATGNLNYENVTDLVVGDPLIYIGANNTGNLYDLGIVASYNDGNYWHTGLARNHNDGYWTFFDKVDAEPTTVIDWGNAVYPTVKFGNLVSTGTINATGNANVGNIGATNGVFTNISGTLTTASQTNITAVGTLGNLSVTGNVTAANFFGVLANGNSNVAIPASSGNVVISAVGNANILTVTGTGVNVFGTLNATGNANVGNIGATNGIFTNVTGTLTTAAQPNITSVGTLTSVTSSGNIIGANVTANTVSFVGNTAIRWANVTTTAITANQTISTVPVSGITGVEWLIKGVDSAGSKYSMATVQAVTDGSSADYSIFATVNLGSSTGTLAVNIVGSNIALQVTPTSTNSTVWTTQYRTI